MDKIVFNDEQEQFIQLALATKSGYLYLKGSGGTGKTETIKEFQRRSKKPVLMTAMSNKASEVLEGITTHKALYLSVATDGSSVLDESGTAAHQYDKPELEDTILVVDEYSMVGDSVMYHIERCNADLVIFIGDVKQIPPVNEEPAKLPKGRECLLTQNHRADNKVLEAYTGALVNKTAKQMKALTPPATIAHSAIADKLLNAEDEAVYVSYLNRDIGAVSDEIIHTAKRIYFKGASIKAWLLETGGLGYGDIRENEKLKHYKFILVNNNVEKPTTKGGNKDETLIFKGRQNFIKWCTPYNIVLPREVANDMVIKVNIERTSNYLTPYIKVTDMKIDEFRDLLDTTLPTEFDGTIKLKVDNPEIAKPRHDVMVANVYRFINTSSIKAVRALPKTLEYVDMYTYRRGRVGVVADGRMVQVPVYVDPYTAVYKGEMNRRVHIQSVMNACLIELLEVKIPKGIHHSQHGYILRNVIEKGMAKTGYKYKGKVIVSKADIFDRDSLEISLKALENIAQLIMQLDNIYAVRDSRTRTIDGSQGSTYDTVYADIRFHKLDKERVYVALTRAKSTLAIVTSM